MGRPTIPTENQKRRGITPFAEIRDDRLDCGISGVVEMLWGVDIDTYESCEGGEGHSYTRPAVRFRGSMADGFLALSRALELGLPVWELRRFWFVNENNEPEGPDWELSFRNIPAYVI